VKPSSLQPPWNLTLNWQQQKNKKNPQPDHLCQAACTAALLTKNKAVFKREMNDLNKGDRSFHRLLSLQMLERIMLTLFYERKQNKIKNPQMGSPRKACDDKVGINLSAKWAWGIYSKPQIKWEADFS